MDEVRKPINSVTNNFDVVAYSAATLIDVSCRSPSIVEVFMKFIKDARKRLERTK
jgi:hypothetical protein